MKYFFNLPYAEVFLKLNGHRASVCFGFGYHGYKGEIYGDWVYTQLPRSKFQLSYQNRNILSKFLIPPGLKSLMSLNPTFEMYIMDAIFTRFNFNIGLSAYYLKFGNYEPYIAFSLTVTKPIQFWSFHAGLNINIPIGVKNKSFEDFKQ